VNSKIPSANGRQVGGQHYQSGGEQHWDRVWRLYGPGYFVGCITKYLERYPMKNGIQDLEKARHFLDKLIELEKEAILPDIAAEHEVDFFAQQELLQSRRATGA
jgi:hypothetical protein